MYRSFNKGKLPIFIIDGLSSLAKAQPERIEELAHMAKALADPRAMTLVFGIGTSTPNAFNGSEYLSAKQTIYVGYLTQKEADQYAAKLIYPSHPEKEKMIKILQENNANLFGMHPCLHI